MEQTDVTAGTTEIWTGTGVAEENGEAFRALADAARKGAGKIPAEFVARHAFAVTAGMDWPVQLAACQEILKRIGFVRRDRLKILSRPSDGLLGSYTTGASSSKTRPYRTVLHSFDIHADRPFDGACGCPDFEKNSLGVCKHLLCIIITIFSTPKMLKQMEPVPSRRKERAQGIRWNPVRASVGAGDPLSQIWWRGKEIETHPVPASLWKARKWFRTAKESPEVLRLKETHAEDEGKRKALLDELLCMVRKAREGSAHFGPDPALLNVLEREKARIESRRKNTGAIFRTYSKELKKPLFPFQEESVRLFLDNGSFLIADDMGLGKTAQAIACCHILWKAREVRRGLLIVPASLKSQWEREWREFTDTPVTIVDGVGSERERFFQAKSGYLIINYEQLIRDLDAVLSWNPDFVVLDEAQRIKNWETKTAAYVKTLQPRFRLVLTGTPMENRLGELASILDWVDGHAIEPKWRLVPWHSQLCDGMEIVSGARNLTTLRTRLSPCMIRRRRDEVIRQLPERNDTRIPVPFSEQQREEHDELSLPIARLTATSKKRPLTPPEFLRLMCLLNHQRIISNGLLLAHFEDEWSELKGTADPSDTALHRLSMAKLVELRRVVRSFVIDQGRKAVIFSQWRRMLLLAEWALSPLLSSGKLRSAFFTGHESQKRRTQNVVEFHDDPSLRVLFLTDAGGVGLNLQRAADCCINLDLPWNPAVLEQRVGRIHRLGQSRPVDVCNLVAEEGIESRIAAIIGSKMALFSGLFDGKSDTVEYESSGRFMATLEKIVEPVKVLSMVHAPSEAESRDMEDTLSDETDKALRDQLPILRETPGGLSPSALGAQPKNFEVRKADDGTLHITAAPAIAGFLAEVFEEFARSLKGGAG